MTASEIDFILAEYRRTVQNLFATGSSDFIDNSSQRHATILIDEMIRHSHSSFRAFAGRMNMAVWNQNVMSALECAIRRGVNVQLIVENDCEPIRFNAMPEIVRGAVRRLVAREGFDPQSFSHCAIGDGKSLRLEMNRKTSAAVFSANNPEYASKAASVFDSLFALSIPYAA